MEEIDIHQEVQRYGEEEFKWNGRPDAAYAYRVVVRTYCRVILKNK